MTEVAQHVTRFEKGHGTCNSDWVSESFSKGVDSELCPKGRKEWAKRIEDRRRAPRLRYSNRGRWSPMEHCRSGGQRLPVRVPRAETSTNLLIVGGPSVTSSCPGGKDRARAPLPSAVAPDNPIWRWLGAEETPCHPLQPPGRTASSGAVHIAPRVVQGASCQSAHSNWVSLEILAVVSVDSQRLSWLSSLPPGGTTHFANCYQVSLHGGLIPEGVVMPVTISVPLKAAPQVCGPLCLSVGGEPAAC